MEIKKVRSIFAVYHKLTSPVFIYKNLKLFDNIKKHKITTYALKTHHV